MSRIGRAPITVPAGVDVSFNGNVVTVKGPKGTLVKTMNSEITFEQEGNVIHVKRSSDDKYHRSLHGLNRTLLSDMIEGVSKGFTKELEVNGIGYRAQKQGNQLVLNVGYSHQVFVDETDTIKIDVPAQNRIVVNGIDKQAVGQFAANIREKRPPEPYKGKGIKYLDEVLRHKEGKTGAKK